jgi:hypothetical protein
MEVSNQSKQSKQMRLFRPNVVDQPYSDTKKTKGQDMQSCDTTQGSRPKKALRRSSKAGTGKPFMPFPFPFAQ